MNKTQKTEQIAQLKDKFARAKVAIFADYKGLPAASADELRKRLRATEAEVKVIKNNVARQAVLDGSLGEDVKKLMDGVVGPTVVAFSYGDPAATAKAIHKFSEENEAFVLKASLLGRTAISAKQVEELAKLPGKEVLVAMLLGTLNGPARGLVTALSGVSRGWVNVLDGIRKKKEEQPSA